MRVLVTGHCGYIGVVLAPMLQAAGHTVVGLDTDLYQRCSFGPEPEPIPTIAKDIRDVTVEDLAGFDALLHLAALSNDPLGDLIPELTYAINYHASVRLANLARTAGIPRFIFSSSCSSYGAAGDEFIDEHAACYPVTPYGVSKLRSEKDLAALACDDFSPTFLRNATAFGLSSRIRFDLVLNNLIAWALTTGQIYLKSDGSPWRPIVHIEDIARAFLAVLEAPRELVHNTVFNVGRNEDNYRIRDLVEIVEATVPGCKIVYAPDAGPDKRNYRVDCRRIAEVLPSFKPQWNAVRGAQELYERYQHVGLALDEFEGPRYKRIAHIKQLLASGELDKTLRWQATAVTPEGSTYDDHNLLPR